MNLKEELDLHDSYVIHWSNSSSDTDWDDFLMRLPSGNHVQSSLWAQVYEAVGWQTIHLIAREDDRIIGGVQVLFKPMSSNLAIGYAPKGPVFEKDDFRLRKEVFSELSRLAQVYDICLLAIQPPIDAIPWLNELPEFDFYPSRIKMDPAGTLLVDLHLDLDEILSQMSARTRYNIRLSARKGIQVREGTASDIDTYYELLRITSKRHQFQIYPKHYFTKMWEVFEPHGCIKLLLAEYNGDIISAQLVIIFGDTATNRLSVWSGKHGNLKPNEALYWFAICWSKEHDLHTYDFEGIDTLAASAIANQDPFPGVLQTSVTSFKLGFGGQVIQLPGVYDHVHNESMRKIYDLAFGKLNHLRV